MAKASQNKTLQTEENVSAFLSKLEDKTKQQDCFKISELMKKVTGFPAKMWGTAIVGFGNYHYVYESGREGDAPLVAFSPRKDAIVLYLSSAFDKREELLAKFGKHKTGKACIYIKTLDDVKQDVLERMILASAKHTRAQYPE